MSTIDGGNFYPRSEDPNIGDTWRTIGKHPLLELKHTVEDRLLVATHITFLGLRAMFHRNQDNTILFSDTIDEPQKQGNAVGTGPLARPPDRIMILTDKHVYVVSSPSSAIFAPACAGSCYPLSEFSRMAVIANANAAVIQFVGGIIGARFSSKKDCERCATAVYSATGTPTETLSADELELLHQRRTFGGSTKMSRFVAQTVRDAYETASVNGGGSEASTSLTHSTITNRKRLLKSDNGNVTNTVDNMLKFVLDGESELSQYDSGFPDRAIQATCETDEIGVDAKPDMVDAATSPIDPSLFGGHHHDGDGGGYHSFGGGGRYFGLNQTGGLNTRSYSRRLADGDDDDEGANVGEHLWTSLKTGPRRGPSATAANQQQQRNSNNNNNLNSNASFRRDPFGESGSEQFSFTNESLVGKAQQQQQNNPNTKTPPGMSSRIASGGGGEFEGASAAAFDSWLGVLSVYRQAMEERGVTSVNRLMRIPQGAEFEAFLDEIGVTRAGHRVLLTNKVNAQRK